MHTAKTTRDYHENGEIATLTKYRWDHTNNRWINLEQTVSDFDERGHMLSDTRNNWDEQNNEWVPAIKGAYEYNEDGRLCSRMPCYWSEYQEEWRCNLKTGYSYHTNGEIASETDYSFYNNRWTPKDSLAYDYYDGFTLDIMEAPEHASSNISPLGQGVIRIYRGFSWDATSRSWQAQSHQEYFVSSFVKP
jgi:hypothetical protein